jgi:alpha-L-fucosidase
LLNFGPTKEGVFSNEMVSRLNEIAAWMKVNEVAISETSMLGKGEEASVPAVAKKQHRYLFVIPTVKGINPPVLPLKSETITFKTPHPIKSIKMLGKDTKINYEENNGTVTIHVPAEIRSVNGNVLDVKVK